MQHIQQDPKKKFDMPDSWPFEDVRELFLHPGVKQPDKDLEEFKWDAPKVEGLVEFLVKEKGFNEDRVRNGAARLQKNMKSAQQSRLEGFFKPQALTEEEKATKKRKHDEKIQQEKKRKKEETKAKKEAKAKPRGGG